MLNIALGFDDKFARHGAVCVASVLSNTTEPVHFNIMYEDGRLSARSRTDIEKIVPRFSGDHKISWITIDGERLKAGYTWHWSSAAVFYPLMLPELCSADRILFLDADTVVTGDLSSLVGLELEGSILGAVHDFVIGGKFLYDGDNARIRDDAKYTYREYYSDLLGFSDAQMRSYFNSGVMLMDLATMRSENFTANTIALLSKHQFAYVDQDCLNLYCRDRVRLLPAGYNFLVNDSYDESMIEPQVWEAIDPFIKGRQIPTIIHNIVKPDLFMTSEEPPLHEVYWGYIKLTPYKKFASRNAYFSWPNIRKWLGRLTSREGRRKLVTTLRGFFKSKSRR